MDDRLESNIYNSEILNGTIKDSIFVRQKPKRAVSEKAQKVSRIGFYFSEYIKGLLFVIVVIGFTLIVPKYFNETQRIAKEMSKSLIRAGDIIVSLLVMIILSPVAGLVFVFLILIPHKNLITRLYCIGENRRKNQRRILNICRKNNSRLKERRRVNLPGRIVELYSFNCEKIKENCDSVLIYCILKKLVRFGLDKIPRLYNILKGEISFIEDFRLSPIYSHPKIPIPHHHLDKYVKAQ